MFQIEFKYYESDVINRIELAFCMENGQTSGNDRTVRVHVLNCLRGIRWPCNDVCSIFIHLIFGRRID